MNFRICCLFSLFLLVITGSAHAVAPAVPSNFAMPMYTYADGSTMVWRLQWTDNSTDEDGFVIYYRYGGVNGSGVHVYQGPYFTGYVPTAWSLTSVTTTSGSTTVTCASTATLSTGWSISGTNIPTGAKVASVTNSTTFVLSTAATGSASGQTLSAASIYKAGSGYSYSINLPIPATSFSSNYVEWWVASYKGLDAAEVSTLSNTAAFPGNWPYGNVTANLAAPSGLTVTPSGDGQFSITYNDNSNSESYFELDYKLSTGSTWYAARLDFGVNASSTTGATTTGVGGYQSGASADGSTTVYLPNFQPGTSYDFQIRAVDWGAHNASAFTSVVSATTQAFKAPSNLVATPVGENSVNLSYTNNSTAASGYHIQVRVQGSTTWLDLGDVDGPYYTSIGPIKLDPKTTYEFQMQTYIRGSNDTTATPTLFSAYSNTATATTTFNAPSGLTATTASASTVNLSWADNSSIEQGFGIYYRLSGGGTFTQLDYAAANATSYAVTGLVPGTAYDFQVTSAYQNNSGTVLESTPSNTVSATTTEGFTCLTYTPITYNLPFSFTLAASTLTAITSRTITGLPAGLSFDSSTGIISGTPTVTGVFACPTSVTFASGVTANSTLTLRIVRAPDVPVATTTISGQTVGNGGNTTLSLTDRFADPDSESAVRVVTNKGTMDFILYNTATPQTVANFLSYVNNPDATGNYNGAVFHRSVPGFIVQGGGFKVQTAPNLFTSIVTTASPINEPGISNLRGTVAMAKVGSDPNSATDQFFVNLADNSSNLDLQNGGFTAFARVAGDGVAVADAIAALPTLATNTVIVDGTSTTSLTDWPLTSTSASMDTSLVVSITSITPVPVLTYTITGNTNPTAVTATVSGTDLQLSGTAPGQSDVTVAATDLDGNTVTQTFTVMVSQAAAIVSSPPTATATVGVSYTFTYSATGFPVPTFSQTSGALPPGLTLSNEGVISGIPTTAGSYTGEVTATNTNGSNAQNFSIAVAKGTATIALGALSQTYDGTPKTATATTTPAGLPVDITYAGSSTAPTDFGSYAVVATINDANYSGTQSGSLTIAGQPASNWRTQYFSTEQITAGLADDNADPDGDGITNLEEYALGLDPLTRTLPLTPTYDANGLTLTFTRPKDLPDVTYAAESTDNLGNWTPVTLEVISDGPVQTIRVRDPLTSGNPNRRFIRLIFGTP